MSRQSLQGHWRPYLWMHIIVIGMSVERELLGYASLKGLFNLKKKRLSYVITIVLWTNIVCMTNNSSGVKFI